MEGYARLEELDMATLSIHGDHGLEHTPDVAPPLHLTTTFFTGNSDGLVYSRAHTMTRTRLEKVLGELDGGHAVTYPTGMSTVTALLFLLKPQVVYIAEGGYFGVHDALQHWKQLIEAYAGEGAFKVVDLNGGQLEALAAKEKEESGKEQRVLIWLETPKNPTCTLQDVPYYSKLAKAIGAKVAVDSTFATPILQKPLSQGADYTVHSCSKFLSGHSDLTAGAIITKTEEEAKVLRQERNYRGNALGNMETWLLLRSLRSLSVRVVQQSQSAAELAKWLDSKVGEEGSHVKKVWHPTL
ncbi:O-acetylhomoserine sulfhydrylase, partial [Balamuthia mandrillaris]